MPLPTQDDPGPINILITGAAGLVGTQLAARLLSAPQYRVLLTDLADPAVPAGVAFPEHAAALRGDVTSPSFVAELLAHPAVQPLHAVFLFHGIMSAAAERDYPLSLRVNVDSVRLIAERLCEVHPGKTPNNSNLSNSTQPNLTQINANRPYWQSNIALDLILHPGVRVVYASSLAVFGPPFPRTGGQGQGGGEKVPEGWTPTPLSTYGAHKLMTEVYLNEVHRRGGLDVFVVRFPTISVRPGKPTGAASSFLSGIIREPMNGVECVVPLRDRGFRAFLTAPSTVEENLMRVLRMDSGALPSHMRQIMFPGISVSVQELMDALAKYGGEDKLWFIREEVDEGLERILRSWAVDYDITTPLRLGLTVDQSADDIVREYVEGLNK
ncbi:uncharacterized protein THITE_2059791 [Thermothielavioides terrestris NRRL 8126]|uniref:NAD-dependent epimerase/dehydratase domain-containing protein n=1 Tax=Thermothielavioides terrestris (strain ATCC 38088 / NRRL 8126) TaxID=578455 RepID=G2RGI8_THETT|nr:uncharacterized protein THITE_2059791 [Thermothielavioides terrestris NRRL 8126]AEO71877.1 hypothetical protein THITE_2059791 [Thermothielavioides terrestris NRRL 8126]